jgi:hypothetical protein
MQSPHPGFPPCDEGLKVATLWCATANTLTAPKDSQVIAQVLKQRLFTRREVRGGEQRFRHISA